LSFTEFCIKRPVFTTVLSLILVVLGIVGYIRVPVRGYPDINPPVISIKTTYSGASASIIESQITTPIENDVIGTTGLKEMHSVSQAGLSRVVLHFNMNVNIDTALNDVRDRLSKISKQLPVGTDPPIIQKRDPDSLQMMVLSATDPNMSPMELTDYINRNILPVLEQQLGVSNVELYNDREFSMKILLNPSKMAAHQVTVNDMTKVLEQQNVNVPTGQIKTADRYYSVLNRGQLGSRKAFKDLIIRDDNGYLLKFGDVATVNVAAENTDSAMRVNGKPAIGISIYALSTANPIKVAAKIKKKLKRINESLPAGMSLNTVWDNTVFLKASLDEVYRDLGFAILLVVVIVSLFLGSLRSAMIPIVTIPICLISACALIYILGYSLNIFTLLALVLAIGLVVDDAIVMLENIYRHLESGLSPQQAAIVGSKEIVFAIIAMTLTLAAVYAPIGFSSGVTGIIFRQFAFTLALTVIISGFVALTLSPMMCARMLTRAKETWLDRMFHQLMDGYKNLLKKLLRHRLWVLIGLAVVIVLGYFCYQSIPTTLEPKEDTGAFMVKVEPPANASFSYLDRYSKEVESQLRALPGVKNVMMMVNPQQGGFAFVILKPWSDRKLSSEEILKRFIHKSSNIAGATVSAFNMSHIGGGGKYGDAVRMVISTDNDFVSLYNTVQNFKTDVSQNPGIKSVTSDLTMNDQQYVLHINRSLAAALGVNIADVSDALRTMLGGAKVTSFEWNNRNYDVILQIPQDQLSQLQIINQLYVRSEKGNMIPLSSLAKITTEVGPQQLPHEGRERATTITIQLAKNYSMGQAIKFLRHDAKTLLPDDYAYHFKGAAKNLVDSHSTMLWAFVLAIVFIYLVLSAQFESFRDPFIILLTVPFCIIGALFTLKLTGNDLSIYTNIGFVTLIGLISKHGILITEFANHEVKQGKAVLDAVVDAAALRLRPIIMTTAAMVIGAIPLVFAGGAGAISRQQIGWVIVGGLLFGTFFSLVVVPVAYTYFVQKN
jgi:multidrug efflux pump